MISISEKVKFIESVMGKGNLSRNQKNLELYCPYCAPSEKTKRKLVVRTDDDRWHCWTCTHKGKSLVRLIRKCGTSDQLRAYVDKYLPATKKGDILINEDEKRDEILCLPDGFTFLATADDSIELRAAKKYLLRRGIDESDLWRFKLCYSTSGEYSRRIIVPSFDATGKLNYYTGRSLDKVKAKYKNPSVPKTDIIFNELNINWKKRLVLCEGPFDLLKCGENATCLLGSDIDESHALFAEIVFNNTPVAVALDGDMWSTKVPKIVKRLQQYGVDTLVVDTRSIPDPGAVTKQEFKELLNKAVEFDWNTMMNERVRRIGSMKLKV